jgi:hypothetical protein
MASACRVPLIELARMRREALAAKVTTVRLPLIVVSATLLLAPGAKAQPPAFAPTDESVFAVAAEKRPDQGRLPPASHGG